MADKKALIVWGGWDGHEPKEVAAIFNDALLSHGFDVEVSDTLDAYLDCGGAIEACARKLFVHPNTVRYRLRRIADFTGRGANRSRAIVRAGELKLSAGEMQTWLQGSRAGVVANGRTNGGCRRRAT